MTYRPTRDLIAPVQTYRPRELMTEGGAIMLARELDRWWHDRGFPQVRHRVIRYTTAGGNVFGVESNLQNGLPPKDAWK